MNRTAARILTRLYPRRWRERYGREFEALLEDQSGGLWTIANVVHSALHARMFPTQGGQMDPNRITFRSIVKQPSALLPLAMSLGALLVLSVAAIYTFAHTGHGLVREADEGATAHLWQILMAGQLPVLIYFAIRWLPRAPRQTLYVIALQAGAILAAMAPVYFLGL
ncbi:hypothetical protein [Edaphobacter acidisoli]|nr:hypothetical protein [Edaphobacter acidisoli]